MTQLFIIACDLMIVELIGIKLIYKQYNIVVTILQYCIKFCQSDIDFIPINGLYSSSGQISTTGIEFFAQQSFQFTVHIMCSEFSPAGPSNNLRIPILDKISIQNESYIWSKVRALQSWQTESYLSFINEIHLIFVELNSWFFIEWLSFAI